MAILASGPDLRRKKRNLVDCRLVGLCGVLHSGLDILISKTGPVEKNRPPTTQVGLELIQRLGANS
jgi:hypothetical protein